MSPTGQGVAKGLSRFDEKLETTTGSGDESVVQEANEGSQVLLRIFTRRHDFTVGAEFLVVAIADLFVQVDALEQNARIEL